MSVQLRKKKLSSGKSSLYLDIYIDGQRYYEFLKLYITKSSTPESRKKNKETLLLAESIRSKKELEVNHSGHGFVPSFKKKTNFLEYFEAYVTQYRNKDKRVINGSYNQFKKFIGTEYISCKDISEKLLIDFKNWLEDRLKGETPHNYFKKLKKVLKQAVKDKVILFNPADDIKNTKMDGIKKDILSSEEIQLLANTACNNPEIKRSFLFACVTGLRYSDVIKLKWSHIKNGTMHINQQKTSKEVIVNLSETAKNLIGQRGKTNENIFKLPTHTACLKVLKTWSKDAGIEKKVTFHVARHSFATNLLIFGNDVKTVSDLLGHSSLTETNKYVRVVEALKEKAVNSLPEIKL